MCGLLNVNSAFWSADHVLKSKGWGTNEAPIASVHFLVFAAPRQKARQIMAGSYDNFGIRFLYPENWELSEESPGEWPHVVSVQSPLGGFWSLHVYEPAESSAKLLSEVQQTMAQEYDSLEFEQISEPLGKIDAVGADMSFYCLDLVVVARVRTFSLSGRTYLILYQAESRDFDELDPVFRAITHSLLQATQ